MLGGTTAEIAVVSIERARGVREEGDGPGVWGRAGSGGAGQARLQAECVGAGRERGPRGLTGPSGRGGEGNWAER